MDNNRFGLYSIVNLNLAVAVCRLCNIKIISVIDYKEMLVVRNKVLEALLKVSKILRRVRR